MKSRKNISRTKSVKHSHQLTDINEESSSKQSSIRLGNGLGKGKSVRAIKYRSKDHE